MSDELEPCPFCGSEDVEMVTYTSARYCQVLCNGCGEANGRHYYDSSSMSECADAWNSRPIEDALRDRIDALEWLREVEEVRRTMSEWHPDKRKKNEDASKRRDNAWVGLCHICQNARAAVES